MSAALGLLGGLVVIVAVGLALLEIRYRSISSGDDWELVSTELVENGIAAGEYWADSVGDGDVDLSFSVATYTGGSTRCDEPQLRYSERFADRVAFGFMWERRTCDDRGVRVVVVRFRDVPESGLEVVFTPTPDSPLCPTLVVFPDGETEPTAVSDCPNW